mmetsp:Transcript_10054/g.21303  ORF Transcript_10054/g.21303 Transcript_10054/m.21303 type:complete len:132 (+) Transcript_10054:1477-1872(+)
MVFVKACVSLPRMYLCLVAFTPYAEIGRLLNQARPVTAMTKYVDSRQVRDGVAMFATTPNPQRPPMTETYTTDSMSASHCSRGRWEAQKSSAPLCVRTEASAIASLSADTVKSPASLSPSTSNGRGTRVTR